MNSKPKSQKLKAENYPKVVPFERKGKRPYIHDLRAFLKQTAREREDQTVTISDPNSDAGLCARCEEPAPIEFAYTVPFRGEPQISSRVYRRFCPECWLRHVEEEFLPRIQD